MRIRQRGGPRDEVLTQLGTGLALIAVTWTDKVTAISTLVTTVVVAVGAIFGLRQLAEAKKARKEMEKTRTHEVIARWGREWIGLREEQTAFWSRSEEEILQLARVVYSQPVEADHEMEAKIREFLKVTAVPDWLHGVAVLRTREAITSDLVESHFLSIIPAVWKRWQPTAEFLRERRSGRKDYYAKLETLAKDLETLAKKLENASGESS